MSRDPDESRDTREPVHQRFHEPCDGARPPADVGRQGLGPRRGGWRRLLRRLDRKRAAPERTAASS